MDSYAHLPLWSTFRKSNEPGETSYRRTVASGGAPELEKELLSIFERTYGAIRRRDFLPTQALRSDDKETLIRSLEPAEEYVLVDGYNIIHAWTSCVSLQRTISMPRGMC